MRALTRFFKVFLLVSVCLSLAACDIFNSNDEGIPTDPGSLLAVISLLGQTNVQTNAAGNAVFLGSVINTGGVTGRNVRVSVNIRDGSNTLIDVATTTTVPADLPPNATGTFRVETSTPPNLVVTFTFVFECTGC